VNGGACWQSFGTFLVRNSSAVKMRIMRPSAYRFSLTQKGAKGGGRGGRSNTVVYEIVATGCVSLRAKEREERVSRKD
jgi:hypothetical protein